MHSFYLLSFEPLGYVVSPLLNGGFGLVVQHQQRMHGDRSARLALLALRRTSDIAQRSLPNLLWLLDVFSPRRIAAPARSAVDHRLLPFVAYLVAEAAKHVLLIH